MKTLEKLSPFLSITPPGKEFREINSLSIDRVRKLSENKWGETRVSFVTSSNKIKIPFIPSFDKKEREPQDSFNCDRIITLKNGTKVYKNARVTIIGICKKIGLGIAKIRGKIYWYSLNRKDIEKFMKTIKETKTHTYTAWVWKDFLYIEKQWKDISMARVPVEEAQKLLKNYSREEIIEHLPVKEIIKIPIDILVGDKYTALFGHV